MLDSMLPCDKLMIPLSVRWLDAPRIWCTTNWQPSSTRFLKFMAVRPISISLQEKAWEVSDLALLHLNIEHTNMHLKLVLIDKFLVFH